MRRGSVPRALLRRFAIGAAGAVALAALVIVVGFARFAAEVAEGQPADVPRADGIVALTGGNDRIGRALGLLAEQRGRRMLISGVNPAVDGTQLAAALGAGLRPYLACCVDLDHAARDTAGNALETRRWARRHGYTSLIVVTNDYHMPRSLLELGQVMPEVELISYPVASPQGKLDRWWREPARLRLLVAEYVKYVVARARGGLARPPEKPVVATAGGFDR